MPLLEKENAIENENEFKEIADKIMDSAVKDLKDGHRISPQLFFFAEDGKRYALPMAWSDDQGKLQARAEAALLAKKLEAKRLIFLSDAFAGDINGPPPSQAPNRKEVLCLIGEDGNDTFGILQEYRRKRKGKRIKMGKRIKLDDPRGLFTGILKG